MPKTILIYDVDLMTGCNILHGSKVSRESDIRSVLYNRPFGVRSFVKNVKTLSENQHNS